MRRKSSLLFFVLPIFLGGCIGSAVFFDSEEEMGEFPNLGTIPDRPAAPDVQLQKNTFDQMLHSQQEALGQNKALRDQFHLETEMSCKK